MDIQQPFFREAGAGPGVVCVHANASTSGQWRELLEILAPRFRVLAPDSYGAGKGPAWPAAGHSLRSEVELLAPLFARAGAPHVLVGHSYGGAVALLAAALRPERVRALVLYEPTLFSLVDAQGPPPNGVDGIRDAALRAGAAAAAGDAEAAARIFIDFWMEDGAFDAMPAGRRPAIAQSVLNVAGWWKALSTDPTPLSAFAALEMPVLYLTGGRSPESAHAVARVLTPVLKDVRVVHLEELGHMGPITHPQVVNPQIERFLDGVA
ncbi:alpha/beta hydrolase [Ramlibacter sp. B156]|uniref:Alpha/beta hydrolase n=1 Tax=Ramlibacter montanisoli TaxID=2732512 RepID=A0A849KG51_9BURK|nr:alpha/beta hydrolase [Ramlibacter montanisoli]